MNFVLVNDKELPLPSRCAHCHTSIAVCYLRDLSSRIPYCGYACYVARKIEKLETAPVVWSCGAGIDALPIRGL